MQNILKGLLSSNTRVKLIVLFMSDINKEFFVRELTRVLDEQINSIRREVENLKEISLLKSRVRNRKKYYFVNKKFILLNELQSMVIKSRTNEEEMVKSIKKMGDVDLIVLSGRFINHEDSSVDLFVVGDIGKEDFASFIRDLEKRDSCEIRYTLMKRDDFEYRRNYNDKFVTGIISDPQNLVVLDSTN
ncbi:MAG: hypothetical protein NTZ80_03460 [Patescibacteria group bacterium]|nr:hypothetical protein [Patescibacteria group bacterium]